MKNFWKEFTPKVKAFSYDDEVIYLIPIQNPHFNKKYDYYVVVHEDAYHLNTGKTEILSENDIIKKFDITL
jgi:hypothetical protein